MNSINPAQVHTSPPRRGEAILAIALALAASVTLIYAGRSEPVATAGPSAQQASAISTEHLCEFTDSVAICRELLRRNHVPEQRLQDAVLYLARRERQPELQLLLELTCELPVDADESEIRNHILLFAEIATSGRNWQSEIRPLVKHPSPATRQVAMATSVLLDDELAPTWATVQSPEHYPELVQALSLVASEPLQEKLYDDVRKLVSLSEDDTQTRQAALQVIPKLAGRQSEKARDLIALLRGRNHDSDVLRVLGKIPSVYWPNDQIGSLASVLIAFAAETVATENHSDQMHVISHIAGELSNKMSTEDRERFQHRLQQIRSSVD